MEGASMKILVTPEASVAVGSEVHDLRRFWRVLLAAIAPLPWLGVAIYYGFMPEVATLDTDEKMHTFTTNHAYTTLQWFDTVFVLLVVPAMLAAAWVARRGAPRLATAAALMMATGFLGGIGRNLDSDQLAYVATQKHLDPATMKTLVDALEANPTAGLGSLLFIVGLVFGSIVLGVGLWRSRAVPPWVGVAVAVVEPLIHSYRSTTPSWQSVSSSWPLASLESVQRFCGCETTTSISRQSPTPSSRLNHEVENFTASPERELS
jgi:MFS superfamily sulfate permease-like transporter